MDSFSTFKFLKVNFYVFLHHGNVWSLGARSGLASQIVTRRSEFEKTVPASLPVRAAATAWGNLLLCNNGESASQSIQLPCFASLNCVYVTPMKFSHTIQKTKQWNRQCKHASLALVPPCLPYSRQVGCCRNGGFPVVDFKVKPWSWCWNPKKMITLSFLYLVLLETEKVGIVVSSNMLSAVHPQENILTNFESRLWGLTVTVQLHAASLF